MACCPAPTPAMLAEAEKAYHDLVLGNKARVVVDQNGDRVEFTSAKREDLYQYIQQLRAQICTTDTGSGHGSNGPVGFLF